MYMYTHMIIIVMYYRLLLFLWFILSCQEVAAQSVPCVAAWSLWVARKRGPLLAFL